MNNYNDHFKKLKSNAHPVRRREIKKKHGSKKQTPKNQFGDISIKTKAVVTLLFFLSLYGFLYPEMLLDMYDRVSVFSVSSAKDMAVPSATKELNEEKSTDDVKTKSVENKPKKLTEVSDNANYIEYLEQRKSDLDLKEKDLKELEEKLQIEKVALEKKVQELDSARREIASKLEGRIQEDEERMKKLVDMYSNMKPQNAAQVIATLDEELAIHVLKRMKKQEAGNILNFMNPDKAKKLSEKYTGY